MDDGLIDFDHFHCSPRNYCAAAIDNQARNLGYGDLLCLEGPRQERRNPHQEGYEGTSLSKHAITSNRNFEGVTVQAASVGITVSCGLLLMTAERLRRF